MESTASELEPMRPARGSTAIDEARGAFVTEASEPLVGGLAGYPHGFGGIGWLPAVDQHPVRRVTAFPAR